MSTLSNVQETDTTKDEPPTDQKIQFQFLARINRNSSEHKVKAESLAQIHNSSLD